MSVNRIILEVHNTLLELRNLHNTVSKPEFSETYDLATDSERSQIHEYIRLIDNYNLTLYLRKLSHTSLETLPIGELRLLAKKYGISYYATIPKSSLLSLLRAKENESRVTVSNDSDALKSGSQTTQVEQAL